MSLTRRSFVATAATLAAGAAASPLRSSAQPATDAGLDSDAWLERPLIGTAGDPLGVRPDFPAALSKCYLNSAYIMPVPKQVAAVGRAFVDRKLTDPIPLGEMLKQTDVVRAQFARLINASADEIGFLFATSEGENIVANALDLRAGDNVVIDALHYETEFVLYGHLRDTRGIDLRVVPHVNGAVRMEDFERVVDKKTKLVSVAWVSHQNGFVHDMRALAELAHARGALLYVDAIQAAGMIPIDVKATGVDLLCCGTYKWLLGGFGVAPFYVRQGLLDRITLDRYGALHVARELPGDKFEIHATAKRFDYATLPFAEVYQLGAGLAYLERVGVPKIEAHTVTLAQELRAGLASHGKRLFTPEGTRSAIVTYWLDEDPAAVKKRFEKAGVVATVREAKREVRVGVGLFNTAEDITSFLRTSRGDS